MVYTVLKDDSVIYNMFIKDRHLVFDKINQDLFLLNNNLKKTPKDLQDFIDEYSKYMSNQTEIDNKFINYLSSNQDTDNDTIYFLTEYSNNIPIYIQKLKDFSHKLLQLKSKYDSDNLSPIKQIWKKISS
jgi:hypothetical protein